jgi:excisionase family DNA binding protein
VTLAGEPLMLTIEEAAAILRVGRSAAYEAARRGEIPTVRIGRALRVPRFRLEEMLGGISQPRASSAAPSPKGRGPARSERAGPRLTDPDATPT